MTALTNRSRRAWRRALHALFLMEALTLAMLLPRIPDIKDALELAPSELGVAFLGIPCGVLIGFLFAPRTVRLVGLRQTSWASVAFLAAAFALPAFARSGAELFCAFGVAGLGVTHTEIALNGQAAAYERATGRGAMSSGHGFWSIGSICGVLTGGYLANMGVELQVQTVATAVILITGVVLAAGALPPDQRPERRSMPMARVPLPTPALLPLCLLPIGVMAIEGIFMDWSAVFMRSVIMSSPFEASLAFATFSAAMALVRLLGDMLLERVGFTLLVTLSAAAVGLGAVIFAIADNATVAICGAAVAGLGVANIYPVALSTAAKAPGEPEQNIAAVTFVSFVLLLGAPAAFGLAVEYAGYRAAFAMGAVMAVPTFFLGCRRTSQRKRAGIRPETVGAMDRRAQ